MVTVVPPWSAGQNPPTLAMLPRGTLLELRFKVQVDLDQGRLSSANSGGSGLGHHPWYPLVPQKWVKILPGLGLPFIFGTFEKGILALTQPHRVRLVDPTAVQSTDSWALHGKQYQALISSLRRPVAVVSPILGWCAAKF